MIGKDPFDLEAIHHVWDRELYTVGNQAAQAAVEMALWDLQGKALGGRSATSSAAAPGLPSRRSSRSAGTTPRLWRQRRAR